MRSHPMVSLRGRTFNRVGVSSRLHQPPIRIKAMRISVRGPRPLAPSGAPQSPRALPAVSTRLRNDRLRATPKGANTSWLTVDAQVGWVPRTALLHCGKDLVSIRNNATMRYMESYITKNEHGYGFGCQPSWLCVECRPCSLAMRAA